MQITPDTLSDLAQGLITERKRQGLSRAQAAAVCNVSTSFIRDAESDPGACSLALLLRLTRGLGIQLQATHWSTDTEQFPEVEP
ncbi:MAG: XRE family transcriptional regulator [Burkholderiales bacterium]|nr:MAG: XRE family transcriptional regulator [Burkholderiales bacterium]